MHKSASVGSRTSHRSSTTFFDDDALNQFLGEDGLRVYARCVRIYCHYGERDFFAKRETIAKQLGLPFWRVKKAFSKLHRLGLVVCHRSRLTIPGLQKGAPPKAVWAHDVVVCPLVRLSAGVRLVAPSCAREAVRREGGRSWGGSRAGAGRPKKVMTEVVSMARIGSFSNSSGSDSNGSLPRNLNSPSLRSGSLRDPTDLSARTRARENSGSRLGSSEFLLDQQKERERISALGTRLIPQIPNGNLIKVPVIPPPPVLRPGLSDQALIDTLSAAYGTVLVQRFGGRAMFRIGEKLREVLVAAARMMFESRIPPIAWVQFSFDAFKQSGQVCAPRVAWVFSEHRLRERYQWFDEERSQYCVPKARPLEEHRQLYSDWNAMWQDLIEANPATRDEVFEIVACWFPGYSFEERVKELQIKSRLMQLSIDDRIRKGEAV